MKKLGAFLLYSLASLGLGVLTVATIGWVVVLLHPAPTVPEHAVLAFDFTKEVTEKNDSSPVDFALNGEKGDLTIRDVVAAIDFAAKDPRVSGVIAEFRGNTMSMAAAQEIRAAMMRLREQGKFSYAFATSFGELTPADKAYYLASSFEEIWLQPEGLLGLTGFATQMPFLREAFDKVGITPDFMHREEYKTATDMFTERGYTDANAEMLSAILDDLTTQLVNDVSAERDIEPLQLFRLMDEAPLTASRALEAGLVDRIGYGDEVEDDALQATGGNGTLLSASEYLSMRRDELRKAEKNTKKKVPTIAFLHAVGEMNQSEGDARKVRGDGIAADALASAIEDAVNDKNVDALLLRVDSPGGSAVAAETIRHALERAQKAGLPVVVSMGSMAGSGGYWVAAQADVIVAEPSTLTGSIGVIAGKLAAKQELWDLLGIHWDSITRGANADLWVATQPFSDPQKRKVDALVGDTYQAFKNHVARARGLSPETVAALAKGRVWTGDQALNNGLVDELGGLYDAVNVTKNVIGLTEDESVFMKIFPAPESVFERFFKMLDQLDGVSANLQKLNSWMQGVLQLGVFDQAQGMRAKAATINY